MWYNITTQLHQRIDQLGDVLIGMRGQEVFQTIIFSDTGLPAELSSKNRWPKLSQGNDDIIYKAPATTVETSNLILNEDIPSVQALGVEEKKTLGSPVKVCLVVLLRNSLRE